MKTFDSFEDLQDELFKIPYVIPRMKGRKYKARIRSDKRWAARPFHYCEKCGIIREPNLHEVRRVCPFKHCVIIYCICGKQSIAWGPVGCPCNRSSGHGTYDELPRPSAKRKAKY